MTTDILARLEAIAAPIHTADRTLTMAPLLDRATAVRERLTAARAAHLLVAERLAQLDAKKLQPRITAEAWPLVGQLLANGRRLKDHLDNDLPGVRSAVRALAAEQPDNDFVANVRELMESLTNADAHVATVDRLAASIHGALQTLDGSIFSAAYVIPPKPAEGGRAESSGAS